MKLILILLILWMISGLVALAIGVITANKPENKGLLEKQIKELSEESGLQEETCLCILYVGFVILGFVGLSIAFYRKVKTWWRENG